MRGTRRSLRQLEGPERGKLGGGGHTCMGGVPMVKAESLLPYRKPRTPGLLGAFSNQAPCKEVYTRYLLFSAPGWGVKAPGMKKHLQSRGQREEAMAGDKPPPQWRCSSALGSGLFRHDTGDIRAGWFCGGWPVSPLCSVEQHHGL